MTCAETYFGHPLLIYLFNCQSWVIVLGIIAVFILLYFLTPSSKEFKENKYMKKIRTLFERIDRKIIDKVAEGVDLELLKNAKATEKLDGMNVRCTIRNGTCVRLEKRRNPDKIQKYKGIIEPWYVDTAISSEDKWLNDALANTDLSQLSDGEWSGEALGTNIQGNPLNLPTNRIVFFTLGQAPVFENVPTTFEELKTWLPQQKSKYGNGCGIEGIVWHCENGEMYKIKCKDF